MTADQQYLLISTELNTYYPCHRTRNVRLSASNYTPREQYERKCPRCKQKWSITRIRMADRPGQRYDRLDWERV